MTKAIPYSPHQKGAKVDTLQGRQCLCWFGGNLAADTL